MSTKKRELVPVHMQRPLNMSEIGRCYGVDYRTLKKWITPFEIEIGKRSGRYFSVNQIKIIVKKLGLPSL